MHGNRQSLETKAAETHVTRCPITACGCGCSRRANAEERSRKAQRRRVDGARGSSGAGGQGETRGPRVVWGSGGGCLNGRAFCGRRDHSHSPVDSRCQHPGRHSPPKVEIKPADVDCRHGPDAGSQRRISQTSTWLCLPARRNSLPAGWDTGRREPALLAKTGIRSHHLNAGHRRSADRQSVVTTPRKRRSGETWRKAVRLVYFRLWVSWRLSRSSLTFPGWLTTSLNEPAA